MTTRRKIGLAAAICGAVFFGFRSCKPVSASASDRTLTAAQTRALLGDYLDFEYYNGTDYVTGQLQYLSSTAVLQNEDENSNPINYFQYNGQQRNIFESCVSSDTAYICYYGNFPDMVVGQGTYYTCSISPRIDFQGVTLTKFVGGFSCIAGYNPEPRYVPYDRVTYYVNGNPSEAKNFYGYPSPTSTAGAYEICFHYRIGNALGRWFTLAPVYYESASQAQISNIQFSRQGNVDASSSGTGGLVRFLISCPTISETGSVSGSSGSSVGSDLTATNIKLDTIISLLSQIAENTQEVDDDSESVPDASEYEVPVMSVPEWFDEAMTLHKASFDVTVDGSPIFGLVPTEETEDGEPTAGGQLFAPNTEDGISLVPADPSSGGVLQSMRFFWSLLADLVETMPIISKLITLFIGASIASWLIFGGRGS